MHLSLQANYYEYGARVLVRVLACVFSWLALQLQHIATTANNDHESLTHCTIVNMHAPLEGLPGKPLCE